MNCELKMDYEVIEYRVNYILVNSMGDIVKETRYCDSELEALCFARRICKRLQSVEILQVRRMICSLEDLKAQYDSELKELGRQFPCYR